MEIKNLIKYKTIQHITGPLIFLKNTHSIGYNEIVEIENNGILKKGIVLETSKDLVLIQCFENTEGLDICNTKVRFLGKPYELEVSKMMLGRIFNGLGKAIDGFAQPVSEHKLNINGSPINPVARVYPQQFIQTGISAIDGLNTLIRGQKLPIFSANGLPHNKLAAQITRQATLYGETANFAVVFAAIGITADDASFFIKNFNEATNISNITMFLNLANDPTVERLMTPRIALTFAEFLAFQLNYNVLVIITDITNYCEALREISILRNEIPGRKAYPGYLYSDLASLYERAGIIKNSKGSITQLPILTMPNDDITHPIPDLTGFITEGQIVLNRELHLKGIYPPINVLTSLSRLMKDGIGKGFTRDDHSHLASQLFALYSKVQEIRELASVIGEDELTLLDHKYLEFGYAFENNFINQSFTENRNIIETLNKGWECIKIMPEEELHRLTEEEIKMYYKK